MLKKSIISFTMIGVVALAVASSGGGDNKGASRPVSGLLSLRKSPGVQLKAGPNYAGTQLNGTAQFNVAMRRGLITYRKGNTIYIVPQVAQPMVKLQPKPDFRTNLDLLRLKLALHK